jgi:hypothetical protein
MKNETKQEIAVAVFGLIVGAIIFTVFAIAMVGLAPIH